MASCVRSIPTKNYQNLMIGFQVTVENVEDVFFETQPYTADDSTDTMLLTEPQRKICTYANSMSNCVDKFLHDAMG